VRSSAVQFSGFLVGLLGISVSHERLLAQGTPPTAEAPAAPGARVFGSDAGLVLNFVEPDKAADFETIVGKLKDALQKSDNPERKQQAATWRVYRAVEPGANGAILYIFDVHPAVHGADYNVSTILAEGFPTTYRTCTNATRTRRIRAERREPDPGGGSRPEAAHDVSPM